MSGGLPGTKLRVHAARDREETEVLWNLPAGDAPSRGPARRRSNSSTRSSAARSKPSGSSAATRWATLAEPFAASGVGWNGPRTRRRPGLLPPHGNFPVRAHPAARGRVGGGRTARWSTAAAWSRSAPRAVPPPVDARPDWWLVSEGRAAAMGFGVGFPLPAGPNEIFDEIRGSFERAHRLRRARSQPRAGWRGKARKPGRCPRREGDAKEAKRRYATPEGALEVFPPDSGRARFWPRPYLPNAEMPDDDYPFVLLTGRVAHQWHTRTKTGKVPSLNKTEPGSLSWKSTPGMRLAARASARVTSLARSSPAGVRVRLPARLAARDAARAAALPPMHWNDLFAPGVAINEVTSENGLPGISPTRTESIAPCAWRRGGRRKTPLPPMPRRRSAQPDSLPIIYG